MVSVLDLRFVGKQRKDLPIFQVILSTKIRDIPKTNIIIYYHKNKNNNFQGSTHIMVGQTEKVGYRSDVQ